MEIATQPVCSQPDSFLESVLLWGVRAGIVLLLLTPFVVTEGTVYPFVVGKALYSRAVIEVVFALWVLLAGLNPAFRPPRSWLLVLLGAGLAWSMVAAGFGVSPQRSLWSNYERMTGLVDAAHWFVLVVVLSSVLRTYGGLRTLFGLNLGVSVVVALLAIAGYFQIDPVFFGEVWERGHPRIGTVLGNPAYLGTYALINFTVALGLLTHSLVTGRSAFEISNLAHFVGRIGLPLQRGTLRAGRLLIAVAALLNLWALSLSGSLAAVAGLLGAAAFLALAFPVVRSVNWMRTTTAAAGSIVGVAAGALFLFWQSESPVTSLAPDANPLAQRMTLLDGVGSYRARESAWRAGVRGFAERPWLGWGPENFIVVFGRHADGVPSEGHVHDRAHNELIEKAVAEGLPGLAGWLALWAFVFWTVVRAAKFQMPGERPFTLFVGAALAGYFLMSQLQFDAAALKLQLSLLFTFVVGLEIAVPGKRPRLPPAANAAMAPLRRKAFAAAVALGGAALAAGGLAANQTIHGSATAFLDVQPGQPGYIARTIAAFPPLANEPRRRLFNYVAYNWQWLRIQDNAEARQLLAEAEVQAQAAIAAEPNSWRLHRAAARMYSAAAATEPDYAALAEWHVERALELAPQL